MSVAAYPAYHDSGVEWLGQIPLAWRVKRFRFVFRESAEKIEDKVVGPMLSVSGYRGIEIKAYDDENRRRLDEDLVGYRVVRRGQLVVNTMWLNYAGLGVSDEEGHVSPAYRSYWLDTALNGRFAHHLLRSSIYVQGYTRLLTGIRPNSLQMSRDELMDFPVLLPPPDEQLAIAAFLDRETAKIDALVEAQRRLIELLKEKRQAAISHAVTKGPDPSAPMKDSGVEWLGEVPAHWSVKPLAKLCRTSTTITYGIIQAGPDIQGGIPYIRTSDMSGDSLPADGYLRTSPEIDAAYSRSKVQTGDLVIAIRATIGKPLMVPPDLDGANLTQGTARFSPGEECVGEYVRYCLISRGAEGEFERLGKGATFKEITLEMLRKFRIPCPSLTEQKAIVQATDHLVDQIDDLVRAASRSVELLQERRAALISAAVTGKIDVRGWTLADVRLAATAEIICLHARKPTFGRVKNQKLLYLAETHAGIREIGGRYERQAAGPYDSELMTLVERELEAAGVMSVSQQDGRGSTVSYSVNRSWKRDRERLKAMLGDRLVAFDQVNAKLADLDTRGAEAVATLYAVWNDALIDGEACDDARVIRGFLDEWHREKREKFKEADLRTWLGWMRRNGLVPEGCGPRTIMGRLFV